LLGQGRSEKAELPHGRHQMVGKGLLLGMLIDNRHDLFVDEGPGRLSDQLFLIFKQVLKAHEIS